MGEAHPWCLEPMDPSHLRLGLGGLALGHAVGVVQHGVQKGADTVGVRVLGYTQPRGYNYRQAYSRSSESGEDPGLRD